MARFRATIQGSAGQVSRLGNMKSGIDSSINGWNIGVIVEGFVDDRGRDCFKVYRTDGSGGTFKKLVATLTEGVFYDD